MIIYSHWLIQPTVRLIARIAVGKPIASGGRFAPEAWLPLTRKRPAATSGEPWALRSYRGSEQKAQRGLSATCRGAAMPEEAS